MEDVFASHLFFSAKHVFSALLLSANGADAYQTGASPQEFDLKNNSGLKARSIGRVKSCIGPSALNRIVPGNLGRWPRLVCGRAFGPEALNRYSAKGATQKIPL